MKKYNIVGIQGIDTRALTKHLRNNGAQPGIISTVDADPSSLLKKVKAHPGISAFDLVKDVTTEKVYTWNEGVWKWQSKGIGGSGLGISNREKTNPQSLTPNPYHVVVYDFGVKFNILRNLAEAGFHVTVVPAQTAAEAVLEMGPDGILLSNGPGDPETVTYAIENTKKLLGKKPVFGICLGHQILGLALGGKTYKLKFGHHGGNHPVKDLSNGRVEITSQNHNYCVDIKSLYGQVKLTHTNLYDGTEEGMQHVDLPVFSVQHHPEAGPGPNDSTHIFSRFRKLIQNGTF
jgi:carbamoyl-phosphate synthase small subunit